MTNETKIELTKSPLAFRQRHLLPLLASGLFVIATTIALTVWTILLSRADAQRVAEVTTSNLTRTLADHFIDTIKEADLGMLSIVDEITRQQKSGSWNGVAIMEAIARQDARHPDLTGFRIYGPDGKLRYGVKNVANRYSDISGRQVFIDLRDKPDLIMEVGPPLFSPALRTWGIAMMHRVNNPDGTFGGVVLCTIELRTLSESYAKLELGPLGSVGLAHTNFELAARFPEMIRPNDPTFTHKVAKEFHDIIASGAPFAQYDYLSTVDGIRRTSTVRRIEGYPYYILVGLAEDDYLKNWRRNSFWLTMFAVLITGLVLVAMVILNRRIIQSLRDEKMLLENEERLALATLYNGVGIWDWNLVTQQMIWDDSMYALYHIRREDFIGTEKAWRASLHQDDLERVDREIDSAIRGDKPFDSEFRVVWPNGEIRYIKAVAKVFRDESGMPLRMLGTNVDITERNLAEALLKESEERYRMLFENSIDGVLLTTPDGRIIEANPAACKMFQRSELEIVQGGREAIVDTSDPNLTLALEERNRTGKFSGELTMLRKDGTKFIGEITTSVFNDKDRETRTSMFIRDITERKQLEDDVRQLAFFDFLTKLPNRRLLDDRLGKAMAASRRSSRYGALMFLDLDNFKPLNDKHGHAVGDLLLIEVARRISSCIRETDTVARFGGDEFVVMLSELEKDKAESISQACVIADKIRVALAEPYLLTMQNEENADFTIEHHCTSSIGLVLFIGHEAIIDEIYKWADMAMYQAKDAGRNQIKFYEQSV